MNIALKSELAKLWQNILCTDPKDIFGDKAEICLQRNWGDDVPQPGFVGGDYRIGGIVFIGMNPGAGPKKDKGLDMRNRKQYEYLNKLRNASDHKRIKAFDELTEVLLSYMCTWKIFNNFVAPILRCTDNTLHDVAYLNLLKWRTKANKGLKEIYKKSWDKHTSKQMEVLSPGAIVVLGKGVKKALDRLWNPKDIYIDHIRRCIGNNIGPEGREDIKRICRRLKNWCNY